MFDSPASTFSTAWKYLKTLFSRFREKLQRSPKYLDFLFFSFGRSSWSFEAWTRDFLQRAKSMKQTSKWHFRIKNFLYNSLLYNISPGLTPPNALFLPGFFAEPTLGFPAGFSVAFLPKSTVNLSTFTFSTFSEVFSTATSLVVGSTTACCFNSALSKLPKKSSSLVFVWATGSVAATAPIWSWPAYFRTASSA